MKTSSKNDISDFRVEMDKVNKIKTNNFCNDLYFYLIQEDTKKLIRKKNIWEGILNLSEELLKSENNYLNGEKAHEILNKHIKFASKKLI